MNFQIWNLNNYVRVQLNTKGREIFMQDRERIGIESGPPNEDADGWCTIQMWELMQIFGPHLVMGAEPPFSMDVQIQLQG